MRGWMRALLSGVVLGVMLIGGAQAATLTCAGVLGNSGERGDTLVRFNRPGASGIGVICDRFGSLWDRGGKGALNRYALDGRLLAQYKIPAGGNTGQIALAGDMVILCIDGQVYQLPVTAPAGSEARAIGVKAECISTNALGNTIAMARGGELALLDVTTGDVKAAGQYTGSIQALELGPDGALYPQVDWKIRKYVDGQQVTDGWPKASPGERAQLLDGCWYGHAWHGTIKRFTATLDPAPGVILGGASGSFIGHLEQNSELANGRGIARVRENLFAVSGMGGIMHLMEWQQPKQQMVIIRRIGAIPSCTTLALDAAGRVWYSVGSWEWHDLPDAPMQYQINGMEEMGQAVTLNNNVVVVPGWMWGKPIFNAGPLTGEIKGGRIESKCALAHGLTGSAVYHDGKRLVLLTITKTGAGQSFFLNGDGGYAGERCPVGLHTVTPVKEWTTLGMKDEQTLLGAADGYVIELTRDGNDWKESRRWNTWNAGEHFGGKIFLSADAGRLWVADRERHRVVVFDLATGEQRALFGTTDISGDILATVAYPETLAARRDRAVVYDSGNQRLLKLEVQ